MYGKFREGHGEPDEPRGALRLRLVGETDGSEGDDDEAPWLDLRGPTACELLLPTERDALLARLGPTRCGPAPTRPPGSSASGAAGRPSARS